jgi:peptidoglycan/xylan/chitin deacetylase (PgdA/CDA1 family)
MCEPWLPPSRRFCAGLTVLLFHDVTDQPSEFQRLTRSWTSIDLFERQLDWIEHHFAVLPPPALRDEGPSVADRPRALVTFDDSWAGVFTNAAPRLARRGLSALAFVNMSTVEGAPDLAAVELFERRRHSGAGEGREGVPRPIVAGVTGLDGVTALIEDATRQFGSHEEYQAFQGVTATPALLERSAEDGLYLGSHLYCHVTASATTDQGFRENYLQNHARLLSHDNYLTMLAFPGGARIEDYAEGHVRSARELGAERAFSADGFTNRSESFLLDRVGMPTFSEHPKDWWYFVHRKGIKRSQH